MTYSSAIVFLGQRIISGVSDYTFVVTNRPDLKVELDSYLTEKGYTHLIVQ